jgi:hypothetical protein
LLGRDPGVDDFLRVRSCGGLFEAIDDRFKQPQVRMLIKSLHGRLPEPFEHPSRRVGQPALEVPATRIERLKDRAR